MQAIQLTKYGKPEEGLRLVEIAEPGEPKSGQFEWHLAKPQVPRRLWVRNLWPHL